MTKIKTPEEKEDEPLIVDPPKDEDEDEKEGSDPEESAKPKPDGDGAKPEEKEPNPKEEEDLKPIKKKIEFDDSPIKSRRPSRRSSMDLHRERAIHQSNQIAASKKFLPRSSYGTGIFLDENAINSGYVRNVDGSDWTHVPSNVNPDDETPVQQTITLGGQPLKIRSTPTEETSFYVPRRYDIKVRKTLVKCPEQYDIFWKSAVSNFLPKSNKFQVMSLKHDDDKLLYEVKNLQTQLQSLQDHLYAHDMAQVFTVVVPEDFHGSPTIEDVSFNVLQDYASLHETQVAMSNAWYNTWVVSDEVRKNLPLSFDTLKANTEAKLFAKSKEQHDEFAPIQRGGPLLLLIILKKIIDVSESSVRYLQNRLKTIDLKKIPGENVDDVVSLIKSTVFALQQCSTDVRNYIPDDCEEIVLKIFQTSSLDEFNAVFRFEERQARQQADKYGGAAKWPSVSTTCALATNTYCRMNGPGASNQWVAPAKQGAAFNASGGPPSNKSTNKCFNCGKVGCIPSTCDEPLDQDRIAKARAAWRARGTGRGRGKDGRGDRRGGAGRGQPRAHKASKDAQGRPLKKNKNGDMVVDTAKYSAMKASSELSAAALKKLDALESKIAANAASNSSSDTKEAQDKAADAKNTPAVFTADVSELRKMLKKAFE